MNNQTSNTVIAAAMSRPIAVTHRQYVRPSIGDAYYTDLRISHGYQGKNQTVRMDSWHQWEKTTALDGT